MIIIRPSRKYFLPKTKFKTDSQFYREWDKKEKIKLLLGNIFNKLVATNNK